MVYNLYHIVCIYSTKIEMNIQIFKNNIRLTIWGLISFPFQRSFIYIYILLLFQGKSTHTQTNEQKKNQTKIRVTITFATQIITNHMHFN